jgi:GNAT superfamily N-acetyltransferase
MSLPDGYRIDHAPDLDATHAFLRQSYWAANIPRELVARALAGSLCFAVKHGDAQVGFARVVTDRATFAYLADVYVLEEHRGKGLGKGLLAAVHAHPELQGLRRWMLVTRDAHGLYQQAGWTGAQKPERIMEIVRASPYG